MSPSALVSRCWTVAGAAEEGREGGGGEETGGGGGGGGAVGARAAPLITVGVWAPQVAQYCASAGRGVWQEGQTWAAIELI